MNIKVIMVIPNHWMGWNIRPIYEACILSTTFNIQIRMAWLNRSTNKATCWAAKMWKFCHFGHQVGTLFIPYMGTRSGSLCIQALYRMRRIIIRFSVVNVQTGALDYKIYIRYNNIFTYWPLWNWWLCFTGTLLFAAHLNFTAINVTKWQIRFSIE